MAQMGAAGVIITEFEGIRCVRKILASRTEIGFYQQGAKALSGVNTPHLIAVQGRDLLIEYLPERLTLEQVNTCINTFEQLATIHRSDYQPQFELKAHQWPREASERALQTLQLPKRSQQSLRAIQQISAELFESDTLISGDSNHGNWGARHNGQRVLFDWERFGYGSPAIDLAPLVFDLGDISAYQTIVERYLRGGGIGEAESLIRHLIIAKAWLVVEVTNILQARNKPDAERYFNWYRQNLPAWLEQIENHF
ncbi:Thiamine kinase [Vibrio xiamenensis]|uniref:Thiamine kinase n=1 Tax=Vibrio xiamenensis TaxID=861298 RepID=A0A1G8GAR8_9VIBR|nr:Thiamine kinase [Vibrio xiamenensis]